MGGFQLSSTWCDAPTPVNGINFVDALLITVNCPLKLPTVFGSKSTCSVVDCPAFNVTGRLTPESEKPVPATLAEFTVTAEVPVEVSVTDCSCGVLTRTLPKPMLVALMPRLAPDVGGVR